MAQTKIEWTSPQRPDGTFMPGYTANLWWGCVEVHAGCDHCYAKAWAKRYQPAELWGKDSARMAIGSVWNNLKNYQRKAAALGEMHRVFVGSMMDIFERSGRNRIVDQNGDPVDSQHWDDDYMDMDELRIRFFDEVVPASPNLLFLLLTKRPGNINKYIPNSWKDAPPANVMFGTSPVDQATFNTLVNQLRQVKGKRFLSIEPQLALILNADLRGIDWVIQGGESGPKKRPFLTHWARIMRDTCKEQGVPYFFKQIDKVQAIPDDLMIREFPL